jgi:hypothetical protein
MAQFAYSGRTRAGQTVSGERMADSMDSAVAALRRDQILVTRITPAKVKLVAADAKAGKLGKKVKTKNLAVFTRQFSVMIDAGLPLVQCLDILGSQEDDKLRRRHPQTRATWNRGVVADAMRQHQRRSTLSHQHGGRRQAGGILDTILERLATIEKAVKLAGQVKSAMICPIAVIVIAGGGRRHSVEGDSDVRVAVCRPRREPSAADAHRHLAQRQSGRFFPFSWPGRVVYRFRRFPDERGTPRSGSVAAKAHPWRPSAEDRRGAVLPTLSTLITPASDSGRTRITRNAGNSIIGMR